MNPNPIDQLFPGIGSPAGIENAFWGGVKWLYLLAFFLYVLFALIVIRQVDMMTRTFQTSAESILKVFSYIHFAVAVGILVIAVMIL